MDILISFTTTVGAVESCRFIRESAIDIVNQSIVIWVKNKKTPNTLRPDTPFNSRENKMPPPPFLAMKNMKVFYTLLQSGYLDRRSNYGINWYAHTKFESYTNGCSNYSYYEYYNGTIIEEYSGAQCPPYDPSSGMAVLGSISDYELYLSVGAIRSMLYVISDGQPHEDGSYRIEYSQSSWRISFGFV